MPFHEMADGSGPAMAGRSAGQASLKKGEGSKGVKTQKYRLEEFCNIGPLLLAAVHPWCWPILAMLKQTICIGLLRS